MSRRDTAFIASYFFSGILFMVFKEFSLPLPAFVMKSLIMIILTLHFLSKIRVAENRLHMLFLAGLIFSWAGDVFLEIPQAYGDMFIPGLVSFLLAHVMYILVFFLTPGKNCITGRKFYLLVPLFIYEAALILYLNPGLGSMQIPVYVYSVVIMTMLAGAVNRLDKVDRTSFWLVVTGAFLFVLSDSAIAVNKFGHGFRGSLWFIMTTYIIAQYLIVTGYVKQFREKQD